ncbi:MAG: hypothetical protein AAF628_17830 [Planctomycetota bacterium]
MRAPSLFAVLLAFAASTAVAQTPVPLANLNPGLPAGSNPREFTALGSVWLFSAERDDVGRELWRTDGTFAGTTLVADIVPGVGSSDVSLLTRVGSNVVFKAAGGLWASDGTSGGTVAIGPVEPLEFPARWNGGGRVVFSGRDAGGGAEPWFTDGTLGGTFRLADLQPGPGSSTPRNLYYAEWHDPVQGLTVASTFFTAWTASFGLELWRVVSGVPERLTDLDPGPGSGLAVDTELAHFAPAAPSPFANGVTVWFPARAPGTGRELYRWFAPFGGAPIVAMVADLAPGSSSSGPTQLVARGNTVVFAATSPATGNELWVSDTVSNGATLVADLNPGAASSSPHDLLPSPGLSVLTQPILFAADDGVHGVELFKYELFSVARLTDLVPFAGSSDPQPLVAAGAHSYFAADGGGLGRELYRTDGFAVELVADVFPGATSSDPRDAVVVDATPGAERVLLAARGPDPLGVEPYLYDGTTQRTSLVRDLQGATELSSDPGPYFEDLAGRVWFTAVTPSAGRELWTSDGTAAGTVMVEDLTPGPASSMIDEVVFTDDGHGFFAHGDPATGREVWWLRNATPFPVLRYDIATGPSSSAPQDLTALGTNLVFSADDGVTGRELYVNAQLYDLNPGPRSSNPRQFTRVNNRLYFTADNGTHGEELWVLQWRAPRGVRVPYMINDLRPGPLGSAPRSLIGYRNNLYCTLDDGSTGRELWESNGIGSGTFRVLDLNPGPGDGIPGPLMITGPALLFAGDDGATGLELWRSNGSSRGTAQIADLRPGPLGSEPTEITRLHTDRVAFVADDGTRGEGLWWATSIATTPTPVPLGPGVSAPRGLFFSSDDLYFTADEPGVGREPWVVETLFMTNPHRIADLAPGPASSCAQDAAFAVAGLQMVFTADDGGLGVEPWTFPADAVARKLGGGCGGYDRRPDLFATAPHVGGNVQFDGSGSGNLPGTVAVFLASAKPLLAAPLPGGCVFHLDFASLVTFGVVPALTQYNAVLPIPPSAAFIGGILRVQPAISPSDDPFFGFDLPPGIELRVGL